MRQDLLIVGIERNGMTLFTIDGHINVWVIHIQYCGI